MSHKDETKTRLLDNAKSKMSKRGAEAGAGGAEATQSLTIVLQQLP
jgi:hypothetical protein